VSKIGLRLPNEGLFATLEVEVGGGKGSGLRSCSGGQLHKLASDSVSILAGFRIWARDIGQMLL